MSGERESGSRVWPQVSAGFRHLREDAAARRWGAWLLAAYAGSAGLLAVALDPAPPLWLWGGLAVPFVLPLWAWGSLSARIARAPSLQTPASGQLGEQGGAMGIFAAGVAHEIKNALTGLILHLQVVERTLEESRGRLGQPAHDALVRRLGRARDGAERVAVIARDLRSFAGQETDPDAEVDVRDVIDSTLQLVQPELRRTAVTVVDTEGHCTITGHRARLGQVLLNLVLNASQAFGDRPRGQNRIVVQARSNDCEVVLEVADNGPGLPPHVVERVFDPYFTTKPEGVGAGLGLFICHKLVQGLGGSLEVHSVPGHGATFRVRLPAAPRHARRDPTRSQRLLCDSLAPGSPSSLHPRPASG